MSPFQVLGLLLRILSLTLRSIVSVKGHASSSDQGSLESTSPSVSVVEVAAVSDCASAVYDSLSLGLDFQYGSAFVKFIQKKKFYLLYTLPEILNISLWWFPSVVQNSV
jgi:hypothetical protein